MVPLLSCSPISPFPYFFLSLSLSLTLSHSLSCSLSQGELRNGPAKFHVLFLMFVALMFFVSLMFLFGYHCWLVSKNRSTLGKACSLIHCIQVLL